MIVSCRRRRYRRVLGRTHPAKPTKASISPYTTLATKKGTR